jgi:hypothetical protein
LLSAFALLPQTHAAEPAPAPAQADRFDVEAAASLKKSAAEKKGVELIVGGERVVGYVTAIGPDSVILTSREHARVVVTSRPHRCGSGRMTLGSEPSWKCPHTALAMDQDRRRKPIHREPDQSRLSGWPFTQRPGQIRVHAGTQLR